MSKISTCSEECEEREIVSRLGASLLALRSTRFIYSWLWIVHSVHHIHDNHNVHGAREVYGAHGVSGVGGDDENDFMKHTFDDTPSSSIWNLNDPVNSQSLNMQSENSNPSELLSASGRLKWEAKQWEAKQWESKQWEAKELEQWRLSLRSTCLTQWFTLMWLFRGVFL